jgi:hypothetical protein
MQTVECLMDTVAAPFRYMSYPEVKRLNNLAGTNYRGQVRIVPCVEGAVIVGDALGAFFLVPVALAVPGGVLPCLAAAVPAVGRYVTEREARHIRAAGFRCSARTYFVKPWVGGDGQACRWDCKDGFLNHGYVLGVYVPAAAGRPAGGGVCCVSGCPFRKGVEL